MSRKIESICGVEPLREREYPIFFKVGEDGVTNIEQGEYSTEPHCERLFYQIYKGAELYAVVNDQAVGVIYFFQDA